MLHSIFFLLRGDAWPHAVSCTAERQDLAIPIQYTQSRGLVELFLSDI